MDNAEPPRNISAGAVRNEPEFVDATQEFWQGCSQLAMGQMVHPSSFTLMDSMACISISDPRLDSGIYPMPDDLLAESDRIDRAHLPEFSTSAPLTAEDVVWMIDRLMACEVSFHLSAPLAQTLFTALYFHQIEDFPILPPQGSASSSSSKTDVAYSGLVFRAYLIATVKCMGIAWDELARGNVIDGEDALLDTCSLSLLQDVPMGYVISQLDEAYGWIEGRSQTQTGSEKRVSESILCRLLLRKYILLSMGTMVDAVGPHGHPQDVGDLDPTTTPMPPAAASREVHSLHSAILEKLDQLDESHGSAHKEYVLRDTSLQAAPTPFSAASFDPSFSRKLQTAGGFPPRPTALPTNANILHFWRSTMSEMTSAVTIYRRVIMGGGDQWADFSTMAELRGCLFLQRPSGPYARSLSISCLTPSQNPAPILIYEFLAPAVGMDATELSKLVAKDLRLPVGQFLPSINPGYMPLPPVTASVGWWLVKGNTLLGSHLTNSLSNRPRAKRQLAKSFARWRGWSTECDQLMSRADLSLSDPSGNSQAQSRAGLLLLIGNFKQAAEAQIFKLASELVLSGFDLELYSPQEMAGAYWLAEGMLVRYEDAIAYFPRASMELTMTTSDTSWMLPCLEIWGLLAIWSLTSAAPPAAGVANGAANGKTSVRVGYGPNTLASLPSYQKAVFHQRFKWLRLPSRDSSGVAQNPSKELDTLWSQWSSDSAEATNEFFPDSERSREAALQDLIAMLIDRSAAAKKAVTNHLTLVSSSSPAGSRWRMCREEACDLLSRVNKTLDEIQGELEKKPKKVKFHTARKEVEHPWFPMPIFLQ